MSLTGRYRAHYTIQAPRWHDEDGEHITMGAVARVSAFHTVEAADDFLTAGQTQGALDPVRIEDGQTGYSVRVYE